MRIKQSNMLKFIIMQMRCLHFNPKIGLGPTIQAHMPSLKLESSLEILSRKKILKFLTVWHVVLKIVLRQALLTIRMPWYVEK